MAEKTNKITFKYIVPANSRDCYVNGVFGGLTPRGELYMHFYSERHPVPISVTQRLNEQGIPENQADLEIGCDAVRLVQASIVVDINTAVAIRDWLGNIIDTVGKRSPEGSMKAN